MTNDNLFNILSEIASAHDKLSKTNRHPIIKEIRLHQDDYDILREVSEPFLTQQCKDLSYSKISGIKIIVDSRVKRLKDCVDILENCA